MGPPRDFERARLWMQAKEADLEEDRKVQKARTLKAEYRAQVPSPDFFSIAPLCGT